MAIYIIHVFVFISSDYSTIAVKSPFCTVVFIGPWIIKCFFFNNYDTDTGIGKISIKPHTFIMHAAVLYYFIQQVYNNKVKTCILIY